MYSTRATSVRKIEDINSMRNTLNCRFRLFKVKYPCSLNRSEDKKITFNTKTWRRHIDRSTVSTFSRNPWLYIPHFLVRLSLCSHCPSTVLYSVHTVFGFTWICIQGTYCVGSLMVTTKEWKSSVNRSVYPLIRIDKSALLYIYIFL